MVNYPYTPSVQPQQQVNTQPNSNIFWVQGEAGAKAYPVAAGGSAALWDSESQTIYVKVVDASGIPQPLRIYDYTERIPVPEVNANYVTKEELDQKFDEILSLLKSKPRYNKKGGNNNGQSSV